MDIPIDQQRGGHQEKLPMEMDMLRIRRKICQILNTEMLPKLPEKNLANW